MQFFFLSRVPFILLFQATLFYVPAFFWRLLNWQTGIDVRNLVQMASDARMMIDNETRRATLETVSNHIFEALTLSKEAAFRMAIVKSPIQNELDIQRIAYFRGVFITILYLFIKFTFAINLFIQFVFMDYFLGTKNVLFGMDLVIDLMNGRQWPETGIFPRVTLCDFEASSIYENFLIFSET